ncbi:MAG: MliC family protein [Rickettsiales bacterium]|jgi:membrane-bound inhibitor of C-type lysozyme|nr:MliC family protein [Rickettsiales bacterium]
MKKYILALSVLALVACSDKAPEVIGMRCGEFDIVAQVSSDGTQIKTAINGQNVSMEIVESASGAKYEGANGEAKLSLWNKGDQWMMIVGDDQVFDCITNTQKAATEQPAEQAE